MLTSEYPGDRRVLLLTWLKPELIAFNGGRCLGVPVQVPPATDVDRSLGAEPGDRGVQLTEAVVVKATAGVPHEPVNAKGFVVAEPVVAGFP